MFTYGYMPYPGRSVRHRAVPRRGHVTYPGRSNLEVIETVTRGGRLDVPPAGTCPTTVGELMLSCWARDADRRPSFADIVQRLQVVVTVSSRLHTEYSSRIPRSPQLPHSKCYGEVANELRVSRRLDGNVANMLRGELA